MMVMVVIMKKKEMIMRRWFVCGWGRVGDII